MGREVENYLVIKSDKVDLDILLENYLDTILNVDSSEEDYLMIYSDDITEIGYFKDYNIKEIRNRKYVSENNFIIFYGYTRKCDLEYSFTKFIEPYLNNLTTCKLFLRDGEAGYDLWEVDFKKDCKDIWYIKKDLPDSFYSLDRLEKFIISKIDE